MHAMPAVEGRPRPCSQSQRGTCCIRKVRCGRAPPSVQQPVHNWPTFQRALRAAPWSLPNVADYSLVLTSTAGGGTTATGSVGSQSLNFSTTPNPADPNK